MPDAMRTEMDDDYRLNKGGAEIAALDAMLNAAIEAAGPEDLQDISTAPKDCDVWVYGANGKHGTATWDKSLHRHVSGVASRHTHWRPLPQGPKA